MVSLCSAGQDGSIAMHIELTRSPLYLRSPEAKISLDLSGSTHICFDTSLREKHDSVRIITVTFFVQKLLTKNNMASRGRWLDLIGRQLA